MRFSTKQSLTYSRDSAASKLAIISSKGYNLIGFIPTILAVKSNLKLGSFLFKKENSYYLCKGRFLFLDCPLSEMNNCFDKQEPLPSKPFFPIFTSSYIFVLLKHEEQYGLFLMRENADLSGHSTLAGAYNDETIGGEIYFEKGIPLLITPKSGCFRSAPEKAQAALKEVFGPDIAKIFFPGVEKEEVKAELERRKKELTQSIYSKMVTFFTTPSSYVGERESGKNKISSCCTLF